MKFPYRVSRFYLRLTLFLIFCAGAGFRLRGEEVAGARFSAADYSRGRYLYDRGVYGEAVRELESYLESAPFDFSARKLLARTYLELEKYSELEEQAEVLLRMEPEDEEAEDWLELARESIAAQLPERAAELRELIESVPDQIEPRLELARVLARMEREDEAAEQFEKAYSLQPDDPDLVLAYARFLAGLGRAEEAEEFYLAYLEEEPDPAIRHEMLNVILTPGMGYMEDEHYERAAEYYREVVERYPEELHLRLQYARMLSWAERFEESLGAYRSYLAEKDEPNIRLEMIRVLAWSEQYAEAARLLLRKLEEDPENIEALVLLADIYRWNDDLDSAVEHYQRALEVEPDYESALAGLEEVEKMRELRREEARRFSISVMEERYRENPEDLEIRLQLARLYVAAGRHGEAREHFEFYLRHWPGRISVRREYARVLRNIGQYHESIRELRRCLLENPEDVSLRMEIVTMLMWEGLYEEARRELEEVQELAPDRVEVHWDLARIHHMEAEWEEALHHYRRVLEIDPDYQVAEVRVRAIEKNPFRRLSEMEDWLERVPDDIETRMEMARLLFEMERYYEALAQARQVLEFRPRHREAGDLIERAESIMARRRMRRIRRLREDLREDPRQHDIHLELARLLREDEDYHRAEFHYRYYLQGHPTDFEVRAEYAEMLSWLPRYRQRAIEEFRRIAERDPYDFDLRRRRTRVLTWEREHWREAEDELEDVLIFDPEDLEMKAAMADLYRYQGRYPEARELYREIEQLDPENERALTGLEAVEDALKPRTDLHFTVASDNDGFSQFSFGGHYHSFNEDGTRWSLGGTFYNFDESADPEIGWFGGSSTAVVLAGAVEGRLADYLTGTGWLELGSYSAAGGAELGGGLRGSYALSPINTLSLAYSSRPAVHDVSTVRSLDERIRVDTVRFDWESEPPGAVEHRETIKRIFFDGFLSYSSFSDSSLRTALLLRPYYRFRDRDEGRPSIDLLAGWRSISFSDQSDYYWSPDSYSGPLLGVRVAGTTWRDIDYQAEFEAFFPDVFTENDASGVSRGLNLNLNRPLSEQWHGGVSFSLSGSPREDDFNYRYFAVTFDLLYEF